MKKIEKKLNKLVKVFFAFLMFFGSTSSISVVFAYEGSNDIVLNVNDENQLVIQYVGELESDQKVNISINEKYTYLDETIDENTVNKQAVEISELTDEDSYLVSTGLLAGIKYDGTYDVIVNLTQDDEVVGTGSYTTNYSFPSGFSYIVKSGINEITPDSDGVYSGSSSEFSVTAKLLSGGLNPTDKFVLDEEEKELDEIEVTQTFDMTDQLFGEYELSLDLDLLVNDLEYSNNPVVKIKYGEYEDNTDVLNSSLNGDFSKYKFSGDSEEGILYVYPNNNQGYSVNELFSILENVLANNNNINYVVSNGEYENIRESFEEAYLEDNTLTFEEYTSDILVDDSTKIVISNNDISISYNCLLVGDLNDDKIINEDDVLLLTDKFVNEEEITDKTNTYQEDQEFDLYDVMYLNEISKGNLEELLDSEVSFESRLSVNDSEIYSGDEFEIDYIVNISQYPLNGLNGLSGLIEYDNSKLELVSVTPKNDFVGSEHDGKFLYIGDSLVDSNDYTLVTFTFKAKSSGNTNVKVTGLETFNNNVYYGNSDDVSIDVIINESNDNTLNSLTVGGQNIELVDDQLDYEITVSNDVTEISVDAITSNIAANITSIDYPEELVEGKNIVTITVTAENGDVLVYTVTVNREAAEEQENTNPTVTNYQNNTDNTDNTDLSDDNTDDNDTVVLDDDDADEEDDDATEDDENVSRIVIIILILLVIAGLIYLIFKDDEEDNDKENVKQSTNANKNQKNTKTKK